MCCPTPAYNFVKNLKFKGERSLLIDSYIIGALVLLHYAATMLLSAVAATSLAQHGLLGCATTVDGGCQTQVV